MKLTIEEKTKLFQKLIEPYLTESIPTDLAKEAFNFCPENNEVAILQDFIDTHFKPEFDFLPAITIIDGIVHTITLYSRDRQHPISNDPFGPNLIGSYNNPVQHDPIQHLTSNNPFKSNLGGL